LRQNSQIRDKQKSSEEEKWFFPVLLVFICFLKAR